MTLAEVRDKCNALLGRIPRDAGILAVLILASGASFGLGYLAGKGAGQGTPLTITSSPLVASTTGMQIVASKSGTKYYYVWCSGVDRITEANRVWFISEDAARAQGYTPAANCDGL